MAEGKILIVEDNGIIALSMSRILARRGYKILGPISSGEEAVEFALRHQPELILMDIFLSGPMDGITAAREIQANLDVVVIYLSGSSEDERLQPGEVICLMKPINEHELVEAVEANLKKS